MPYKDKNKQREYNKNYQRKWKEKKVNREKLRAYGQKHYWKHRDEIRKRKNSQNRKNEQTYEVRARRHHRAKIKVLKMYGGDKPKCANCGDKRYECLQIDHIDNDGNIERRKIPGGENFYYWLIKQKIKKNKYQVLCANCNQIKRVRNLVSYQKGLKNIKEWEEWSKCKNIKTPEEIKQFWNKKRKS